MTGLDCLKAEMIKRGYTKQQTESKAVIGVLEIVSGANGEYSKMDRLQQEVKLLEERKQNLYKTCLEYETKAYSCKAELEKIIETVNNHADALYKEIISYIEAFQNTINDCESIEARDALKAAQMFVNTVDVDTKYDNTAFIIGLASILSQGKVTAIDELRKINKKIPKLQMEAKPGMRYGGIHMNKQWRITDTDSRYFAEF